MCLYYYNHSRLLVVVNLLCSLLTPLSQESFHTVKKLLVRFFLLRQYSTQVTL